MDLISNIEETPLVSRELCEVVNINSLYFGHEVFVSHSAYAAGKEWFKVVISERDDTMRGIDVWFSKNELEFL